MSCYLFTKENFMKTGYSITLDKIIKEFSLETLYLPKPAEEIVISSTEINRPGLQLSGYFDFFDERRIQIFGLSEISFLKSFSKDAASYIQ